MLRQSLQTLMWSQECRQLPEISSRRDGMKVASRNFRRRGEVGRTTTISNYAQSLGKKYAPAASNIPRRAEMGPCGAPLNV